MNTVDVCESYDPEMTTERTQNFHMKKVCIGLTSVTAALVGLFLFTRNPGNGFAFDDWTFVATRHEISLRSLLEPHFGHLSALPVMVYVFCFRIFGLDNYEVFRIITIVVHLAVAISAGEVIRRRQGFTFAYLVVLLLALSGIGAQNPLWGFQIGFMGGLLFFVLAVVWTDSNKFADRWRSDAPVMILLLAAVSCAGSGLGSLGAFWFLVVLDRKLRRLWWVVGIPTVLYAGWYLKFSASDPFFKPTPSQVLKFVVDGMSGSLSGLFGVDIMWGHMALGALVLCSIYHWRRHGFSARQNIWWVYALTFWTLTGLKRAVFVSPLSSRYLWIGSFALVLQIVEYIPFRCFAVNYRRLLIAVGTVAITLASWGSYTLLSGYRDFQRGWVNHSLVLNTILLSNRERVDPMLPAHSLGGIHYDTAGGFFEGVDLFGPPTSRSVEEILARDDLRYDAEYAMVELGLMTVDLVDSNCSGSSSVSEMTIDEGATAIFQITESTSIRVSRFLENSSALNENVRVLDPGVYSISLGSDGFVMPFQVQFDRVVTRCV